MTVRYGVVLFDDAFRKGRVAKMRAATNGFASIEGGKARRIKSVTELESDVRWLTNFGFQDFNGNLLGRHPNLYSAGFLRIDLAQLSDEIGAGAEQLPVDAAAEALSGLFSRVMQLATSLLQVDLAKPIAAGITKTLCEFINARTVNRNVPPDEINSAMEHSFQTWNACMSKFPTDWKSVTLRRPRYLHAIDILTTPVPSERRWTYLQGQRLPSLNADRIEWCLGNELPVLANIVVRGRRGGFADLISYSSGSSLPRTWASQPELLLLSQYCDVEVLGAFVCEGGFEHQAELDSFPSLGDFSLASTSLGILAENFWVAMASPRIQKGRKFYPPRAIWYRAMDRVLMFMRAAELHRNQFKIFGYGTGSVIAYYPSGATQDMVALATELGLDVPVSKYAELRTEVRLGADE